MFCAFVILSLINFRFKFSTVTTGAFRDCFVTFINETLGKAQESPVKQDKDKKKKKKKTRASTESANEIGESLSSKESSAENKAILDKVNSMNWEELFLTTGMPKHVPDFSNSLSAAAEALAKKWILFAEEDSGVVASLDDIKVIIRFCAVRM